MADVSWHSLGIDQGFIRAMANVNFHAVFSDAHGTADVGGDMMSQLEADDSPINQFQWYRSFPFQLIPSLDDTGSSAPGSFIFKQKEAVQFTTRSPPTAKPSQLPRVATGTGNALD